MVAVFRIASVEDCKPNAYRDLTDIERSEGAYGKLVGHAHSSWLLSASQWLLSGMEVECRHIT